MSLLIRLYYTEIVKSKNTFALWLTIIGAGVIPFVLFITYAYNSQMFIPESGINPWNEIFLRSFNGITLFTPLFIILIIGLLFNIEQRSNAWKHLFVLPASKGSIYTSKYVFVFSLVLAYYLLFALLTWGTGIILGLYKSNLGFLKYSPEWNKILRFLFKFFVGTLGIIAIHFWLSFRLKNLISNLGIGLAGIAFAILLNGSKGGLIILFPYSFPILMLNYKANPVHFFDNFHYVSLIYFIIISALSYYDFTKKFNG